MSTRHLKHVVSLGLAIGFLFGASPDMKAAAPADAMVSTVLSSPCAVYALPRAGVSRVTALGLSVALQPD